MTRSEQCSAELFWCNWATGVSEFLSNISYISVYLNRSDWRAVWLGLCQGIFLKLISYNLLSAIITKDNSLCVVVSPELNYGTSFKLFLSGELSVQLCLSLSLFLPPRSFSRHFTTPYREWITPLSMPELHRLCSPELVCDTRASAIDQ